MVIATLLLSLGGVVDEGRELLELICMDCHAGERAEASFDLGAALAQDPLAAALFDWRRARGMVESLGMPPEDALSEAERAALLAFFGAIEAEALELGGAVGQEPLRRLTRTELGNSFRELLGVELELDSLLPPEQVAENGFEANAATLFVTPEWLGRARTATRIALLEALPEAPGSAPALPRLDPARFDLGHFLRRAFRRPVQRDELLHYQGTWDALRAAGASERSGLRQILAEVFASPHFQLRLEDAALPDDAVARAAGERPVSDHGLASRLSFLFWCAPPDDELLDLAEAGDLSRESVFAAQVTRLLRDPRGLEFGRAFGGQWLGTYPLGTRIKADPIDEPSMTGWLQESMREEVARFVHALFVEERTLEDFLRGDFTFVNPVLASFYGMEDLEQEGYVRARVFDSRRRGILGKAGVLAVTSYPERTSPVLRGAWILDELLGAPPPPPPPGASELDLAALERRGAEGRRERLELHREATACAGCHGQIDPLGFALEGFDHLGRTRRRFQDGEPVDTRGQLPDGSPFQGPTGLARALLGTRRADLAREAARRLLTYALARGLTWQDERTVVELGGVLEREGFGALLRAVLASRPFRNVELVP